MPRARRVSSATFYKWTAPYGGMDVSQARKLNYTHWEDQNGVKRYGCEILADEVNFLSRGAAKDNQSDNHDASEID